MPAGILTLIFFATRSMPSPLQCLQLSFGNTPSPPHFPHWPLVRKTPRIVCRVCKTSPLPPHSLHVIRGVPGSARLPLHREHLSNFFNSSVRSAPVTASKNSISIAISMSLPRDERERLAPLMLDEDARPPKNSLKISPISRENPANSLPPKLPPARAPPCRNAFIISSQCAPPVADSHPPICSKLAPN